MILELDKVYRDRKGREWRVISLHNGQRADIGPVTAARWEGKQYHTRIFLKDGTFSVPDTKMDLIEEVK